MASGTETSVGITSGFGTNKSSTGTVEPDTLEPIVRYRPSSSVFILISEKIKMSFPALLVILLLAFTSASGNE